LGVLTDCLCKVRRGHRAIGESREDSLCDGLVLFLDFAVGGFSLGVLVVEFEDSLTSIGEFCLTNLATDNCGVKLSCGHFLVCHILQFLFSVFMSSALSFLHIYYITKLVICQEVLKSFFKNFFKTNVRDFTPSDFPPRDSYAPLVLSS
jgi:hypothetical protein